VNDDRTARVWTSITTQALAHGVAPDARHACYACAEALQATGVGLSLSLTRTPGRALPEPVIATSPIAERLEELQFTLGEGPSPEAAAQDRPVLVADLAADVNQRRWPGFLAAVGAHDIAAIFAFPVSSGGARVGVLTVYRAVTGNLSGPELADGLAYADAVLVLTLDHHSGLPVSSGGRRGFDPVDFRAEVHQAAGMVSAQLGVSVTDALSRLRAYAYAQDRRLADIAHAVVSRRLRFHPDGSVGAPDADDVADTNEGRADDSDLEGRA